MRQLKCSDPASGCRRPQEAPNARRIVFLPFRPRVASPPGCATGSKGGQRGPQGPDPKTPYGMGGNPSRVNARRTGQPTQSRPYVWQHSYRYTCQTSDGRRCQNGRGPSWGHSSDCQAVTQPIHSWKDSYLLVVTNSRPPCKHPDGVEPPVHPNYLGLSGPFFVFNHDQLPLFALHNGVLFQYSAFWPFPSLG